MYNRPIVNHSTLDELQSVKSTHDDDDDVVFLGLQTCTNCTILASIKQLYEKDFRNKKILSIF